MASAAAGCDWDWDAVVDSSGAAQSNCSRQLFKLLQKYSVCVCVSLTAQTRPGCCSSYCPLRARSLAHSVNLIENHKNWSFRHNEQSNLAAGNDKCYQSACQQQQQQQQQKKEKTTRKVKTTGKTGKTKAETDKFNSCALSSSQRKALPHLSERGRHSERERER